MLEVVDDAPDVGDAGVRVFEEVRLVAAGALVGGVVADSCEAVVGEFLGVEAGCLLFDTAIGMDDNQGGGLRGGVRGLEEQSGELEGAFGDSDGGHFAIGMFESILVWQCESVDRGCQLKIQTGPKTVGDRGKDRSMT